MIKLHEHLNERRDLLHKFGLCLQPFAAVIGPTEKPLQYLVMLDDFSYEVESPLKALDIVFKTFFALHVHYPPEAEQLYYFLQQYVYGIKTRQDKNLKTAKEIGLRYEIYKREHSKN